MKLEKMSKEELETYSYIELAQMILKEEKKSLNTRDIFKKICDLLGMSDDEYASKIGDFYTSLTTDKTFILLENGDWDLRDHHSVKVSLNDESIDDEEDLTETEEELDDEMDDMADEDLHDMDDDANLDDTDPDEIDDVDDDDDLTIVDEDDLEE